MQITSFRGVEIMNSASWSRKIQSLVPQSLALGVSRNFSSRLSAAVASELEWYNYTSAAVAYLFRDLSEKREHCSWNNHHIAFKCKCCVMTPISRVDHPSVGVNY